MTDCRHTSRARCPLALLPLVALAGALLWGAQGPAAEASPPAQPATVVAPSDPLKRTSPYGTVTGFLQAAGRKDYERAGRYLEPHGPLPSVSDTEAARQLAEILDHNFLGSLDDVSRHAEGDPDDGLPPDREAIGIARTLLGGRTLSIELVRLADRDLGPIWLFAADTLEQVPAFYAARLLGVTADKLPTWPNLEVFPNLTILDLLLFALAIPVAWALGRLALSAAGWALLHLPGRRVRETVDRKGGLLARAPVRLAVTVLTHYALVYLVLPLLYAQYYRRGVRILIVVALYWLFSSLTDEVAARIEARASASYQASIHSLLVLGRRMWKVLIALVLLLLVLKSYGLNVSAAVAGLGIGGIALGLGAQKTLENLFGGIAVLSDSTIRVGDFCRVGDLSGTVEDVGLRATRLRTIARTVVTVPNGALSTTNVENLTGRDRILFRHTLSLRYETSADQLRYVIVQIREMLYRHPRVDPTELRVRLVRCGTSSLDVEAFAYILTTVYVEFLSVQEDLLLRVMDIVEASGSGFAFPSQTTYLGRDRGLDPQKAAAARAAVERLRQEGRLPFPDHDAETVARLRRAPDAPGTGSPSTPRPPGSPAVRAGCG